MFGGLERFFFLSMNLVYISAARKREMWVTPQTTCLLNATAMTALLPEWQHVMTCDADGKLGWDAWWHRTKKKNLLSMIWVYIRPDGKRDTWAVTALVQDWQKGTSFDLHVRWIRTFLKISLSMNLIYISAARKREMWVILQTTCLPNATAMTELFQ